MIANDGNNADEDSRKENDVMTPVIIFIILLICSIAIACIIFWVLRKRKQKLHETVSIPDIKLNGGIFIVRLQSRCRKIRISQAIKIICINGAPH